jgi:hypothetical protein
MQTTDLIEFMRDGVSDQDNTAVTADEYTRAVAQAVREYSRHNPDVAETDLATTSGVTDYTLPSGTIRALVDVDAAGANQDFIVFGQTLRLAIAPDGSTHTLTLLRQHAADSGGNYPTIPDDHLDYVGTLGVAALLERIADDIARRSDIKEGASSESWPHNARALLRSAAYKRAVVADALSDYTPYVG